MTPVVASAVQKWWCATRDLHGAGEDEELADEAGEHGQADGGERGDDEHGDDPGQLRGEAAELAHVVGAVALVEQAQQHEERGAGERSR